METAGRPKNQPPGFFRLPRDSIPAASALRGFPPIARPRRVTKPPPEPGGESHLIGMGERNRVDYSPCRDVLARRYDKKSGQTGYDLYHRSTAFRLFRALARAAGQRFNSFRLT